jgi:hypothetical protein
MISRPMRRKIPITDPLTALKMPEFIVIVITSKIIIIRVE